MFGSNPTIMPPEPNACFRETTKEPSVADMRREAAIHRNLPERNKAPRGALPYQTLP